ncbi:hypothetical protein RFI_22058 [Reticulomyxa filosa]|uniref:Uncharacterized protein n=1 Tax=Reticulomyxa filosa TaxID=46433 RepID=X6MNS0_RETFI|nr:hypothetical protein RFI_22058 [Reticulomyxa filosa]|eukprot:ETO15306.1 hypothetical protein RFI_22058 [Reticulomyxa filosa]
MLFVDVYFEYIPLFQLLLALQWQTSTCQLSFIAHNLFISSFWSGFLLQKDTIRFSFLISKTWKKKRKYLFCNSISFDDKVKTNKKQ